MIKIWKKIKSKVVQKNPWFTLREDDVLRPDGKAGKYFYLKAHNGVAVIAEDDSGVYLVGQTRYPIGNKYSWEIVGGAIEEDERPLEAAKRELKEEAGIEAEEWIDLGYTFVANSVSSEKDFVFLARGLKKGEADPDATEDITVKKVSFQNLRTMISDNEITCGFSTSAICKYLLYKNKI